MFSLEELFCAVDDFCQTFEPLWNKQLLNHSLQTRARDQVQTLPSPYTDVPQNHWAYKAVLAMYYCGAHQGQIPPEQFQRLQECQSR